MRLFLLVTLPLVVISTTSPLQIPRGGAMIDADKLILAKKVAYTFNGLMAPAASNLYTKLYKTEPAPEGTLKGYCAEQMLWSIAGVALLTHLADSNTGVDRALGWSALPSLYFQYKETAKGSYDKLGFKKGAGPLVAGVVGVCVASMLTKYGLEADLASKILIGLTFLSCGVSAFLPKTGASWKGLSLSGGETKWWSLANKAALEWAVIAAALKQGVSASKAIGYGSLALAAFLAHANLVEDNVCENVPVIHAIYIAFSVVVGALLGFPAKVKAPSP